MRKPQSRLGAKSGIVELMAHPWFKDFSWDDLQSRKMRAPYLPDTTVDNFDTNHVNNSEWKDQDAVKENELQLRRDSIQELFKGYYFNKHDV